MIIVDSSVWISFFASVPTPQVDVLTSISDRTQILVGDVVMLEVLRGAKTERAARQIEEDLRRFDVARMLDAGIAAQAARNYRALRGEGITIRNSVDLIIGTYCIEHDHQLLYRDRDFDQMRRLGLKAYRG